MTNNFKKIYTVENNQDGHIIAHHIKEVVKKDIKREFVYQGEIISVDIKDYQGILNQITSQLVRHNPQGKIEWIDINETKHPYQNIRIAAFELTPSYYEQILNQEKSLDELKQTIFSLDKNKSIETSTILIPDKQTVYLEKDLLEIAKEDDDFWKKLRMKSVQEIFEYQRTYYLNLIGNNLIEFAPYIENYYLTNRVGKVLKK